MTEKQRIKQAEEHYKAYRLSSWTDIFQAYGRPSFKKISAWQYCKELCRQKGGVNLKVITRNTDVFTAGFESVNEEGIPQFTYIAPTYHITIDIER